MFTRLLLVICICIVLALVIYLFYWNRLIAFCIGQIIRLLYWNQEAASIWVEIGSIHFSLLAGRIIFKDFAYHSSNQTVKIVKGQIQWRYWIRVPTAEEDIGSVRGDESGKAKEAVWSSCRIQLSLEGLEWFLYNRTAAYDGILAQMEASLNRSTSRMSERMRTKSRQESNHPTTYPPSTTKASLRVPSIIRNAAAWLKQQLPNLDPKDLLPLGIEVATGAIVLGNPSTPTLLLCEFRVANGTFGVVASRSKYDLYKQLLHMRFTNALIRLVDNEEYADPMTTVGELLHARVEREKSPKNSGGTFASYKTFARIWKQMRLFNQVLEYYAERKQQHQLKTRAGFAAQSSSASSSRKAKKVEEEETPIGIDFSTYEYAIERKILETPSLDLTYYVDVVGDVPPLPHGDPFSRGDVVDIGNGDTAPEWGFELIINGGTLKYGPWADRQRAELQKIFFPSTYQDNVPSVRLKPGDKRIWTALNVFVELRNETVLHIPFREASQDWKWDGKADIPRRPKRRENASITVSIGDRSSINYVLPMVIGADGYESTLEVHLDTIAVASSLNDIKLVKSESCRIRGEMPSPLEWNGERTWVFSIVLRQPVLYLLRDHINMFTDLGKDWSSGPPTDWQRFIPTVYQANIDLHHYELNLYLNDHNIIDKPLVAEENVLLTVRGESLKTGATVPSNKFRPMVSTVPFTVNAPGLSVDISVPRWNTYALHAPPRGHSVVKSEVLQVSGSYRYHAEAREDAVDNLHLDLKLSRTALKALGWSIRYYMVLKDNYFGSFTHFSTLNEYLDKKRKKSHVGDPITLKYRPGKHNMLQVELLLVAEQALVTLPAGLLAYRTSSQKVKGDDVEDDTGACLMLHIPEIQLHLRLHDFFMEMSLNIDPIRGYIDRNLPERVVYTKPPLQDQKPLLVIDGVDVVANRLFGPLPSTATYLCIWEIKVGDVSTTLSASDAMMLMAVGKTFGLHFVDHVNAPADEFIPPLDADITFYKVSVSSLEVIWQAGNAALVLALREGIKVNTNDLAADNYRKVISLSVPKVSARVLVTSQERRASWLEAAEVATDAFVDVYSAPKGYKALNAAQVAFVKEQDEPTRRVDRMVAGLAGDGVSVSLDAAGFHNGVFLPQPSLPNPGFRRPRTPPKTAQRRSVDSRPLQWRPKLEVTDSEDDGLSEADRDARVANSRFSNGRPAFNDEEHAMSSGDESDDADLTDGDSLDSDWSDTAESPSSHKDAALLSFYAPLSRHYTKENRFHLVRDKPALARYLDDFADSGRASPHEASKMSIPEDSKDSRDTTHIRIRTCKALEISANPLLLLAYGYLEDDVKSMPVECEMIVDSLMMQSISKTLSDGETRSCLFFDVQVFSMRAVVLHHIPLPQEGRPLGREMHSTAPSKLDGTAIVGVSIDSLSLTGCLLDDEKTVEVKTHRIAATTNTSIDKRTMNSGAPASVIFNGSISGLTGQLSNRTGSLHIRGISLATGHDGPEILALMGLSLLASAKLIASRLKDTTRSRESLALFAIEDALKSSQNHSIIDTLSTIQPSYLVQSGTPWTLRSDPVFRLFFHLRSCLGHIGDARDEVEVPRSHGMDELKRLLDQRLSLLEQDDISVSQFPQLRKLFPGLESEPLIPESPADEEPVDAIGLQFDEIEVAVVPPQGLSTSKLVLRDISCQLRKDKLELVQFAMSFPTSMSQTSFRDQVPRPFRRWKVSLALGDSEVAVFPSLLPYIQHMLRVRRQYLSPVVPPTSPTSPETPSMRNPKIMNLLVVTFIRKIRLRAAADNLVFEIGIVGWQSSSSLLLSQLTPDHSMAHSIIFEEVYLQAKSPSDPTKENPQDILAAITCHSGKMSVVSKDESPTPKIAYRGVFSIDDLRLDVPRSALRLYRFAEEWRADYLPGIEATVKSMLSEVGSSKQPETPPPSASPKAISSNITGSLGQVSVALQVMHGTWVTLEVHKIVAYARSPLANTISPTHTFGLQLAKIILNVAATPGPSHPLSRSGVRLQLPAISLAGHYDGNCVHTLALVDHIELKVKPSHWDTLLGIQQKFGQDFNDLVGLMQKTRSKQPSPRPVPIQKTSLQYGAFVKMKGFKLGLEGLSSTLSLECLDIRGGLNNAEGVSWDLSLTSLTLSLTTRPPADMPYLRHQRCAFVTIDFKVTGINDNSAETLAQTLELTVSKIHAVMQPSSIGEVGDFVDHLQAEMLERQERRSLELAAFKEKTRTILETFDVKVRDVQLEETTSWLHSYVLHVTIQNVGVAFPLSNDDLQRQSASAAVPAFLFSIRSITFSTTRGETGEATMKRLCLQFVSRFNQTLPEDFTAEKHSTRNRLIYPEMRATLRSSTSSSSRKIWIDANVDGFIVDFDSAVPDYVFSLIDVYRQGKDRVIQLSTTVPRTPTSAIPSPEVKKTDESHYTSLPTSNVFASLTFLSGKVRAYSSAATRELKARSLANPFQELTDEQVLDVGAEVFNLPVVSVWAEYRATPASNKFSVENVEKGPSILMLRSTVHSSRNTLRPQLLPFVSEVIGRVESRMRKTSARSPPRAPTILTPRTPYGPPKQFPTSEPESDFVSSMQLSFSLRIDRSRLELTCQPDVNVVAGLNWESGGFMVNVSPGAREVSFTGSVGGLSIGLKHGFLSEDCVNLDARDLAFSVTFNKTSTKEGETISSISAVLDTEFLGGVRFSRLQDVLCFKAVWLDRIPVFQDQAKSQSQPTGGELEGPQRKDQGLSILLLVRIRQIKLAVDLGQSISHIELDLKNAILRSTLTDSSNEVSIFVEDVAVSANGNLSGHVRVPDCLFNTIHRKSTLSSQRSDGQMLELRMTSGALIAALESDHQKLLHYRAEPLEVRVFDDWSYTGSNEEGERPLRLSFTVDSPEIVMVATVGTIPKMMSYANKFKANIDIQQKAASRESKTYWATRTPKPENPLSAVAEAMLDNARSRFREFEPRLSYVIRQSIKLRLDLLRLVVFPRSMNDAEIAQFVGQGVRAELNRVIESVHHPAKRDLRLSFKSMAISKHTHFHPDLAPPTPLEGFDGRAWLEKMFKDSAGATIVGLPSMKMHMASEEVYPEEGERQLIYDFESVFRREEGMQAYEDIFITLNMSLYAWLTILRKNLTREMAQVNATENWRTAVSAATSPVPGRKKAPEPLPLDMPSETSSRSSTLPAPASTPEEGETCNLLSPGAPSSARYPSIEQTARGVYPQPPRSATVSTRSSLSPPILAAKKSDPTSPDTNSSSLGSSDPSNLPGSSAIVYQPRERHIERLTMRQLGEATPDVMHPFFMKKAGFNLEDSLPQYVHEYATIPLEEIMEVLFKLYSQQLLKGHETIDPSPAQS